MSDAGQIAFLSAVVSDPEMKKLASKLTPGQREAMKKNIIAML